MVSDRQELSTAKGSNLLMLYASRVEQASNDSACLHLEDSKAWALAYLLVLLELNVHISRHFRELSSAIALPEEVAVAYLQCQHSMQLCPP